MLVLCQYWANRQQTTANGRHGTGGCGPSASLGAGSADERIGCQRIGSGLAEQRRRRRFSDSAAQALSVRLKEPDPWYVAHQGLRFGLRLHGSAATLGKGRIQVSVDYGREFAIIGWLTNGKRCNATTYLVLLMMEEVRFLIHQLRG